MFDKANEILGFNITDLMFNGTDEDLRQTKVTQPAIFLHSVILAKTMGDDFNPDMVAGHSLGEFSALVAAGAMAEERYAEDIRTRMPEFKNLLETFFEKVECVDADAYTPELSALYDVTIFDALPPSQLSFEDGLRLVSARAQAMQKACEKTPSTMAAVLALPDARVEELCASVTEGVVVPANYNCPGQIVISGSIEGVDAACAKMLEAGAKRALKLKVGGAFHSPLMEPARAELADAIAHTDFHAPKCPVYQNVNAEPQTDPETIKKNLIAQLTAPVRWTQTIQNMIAAGADTFVEVGPGAVLQGLVKKISSEVATSGIQ